MVVPDTGDKYTDFTPFSEMSKNAGLLSGGCCQENTTESDAITEESGGVLMREFVNVALVR